MDCDLIFLSHSDFDLTAPAHMQEQLAKIGPQVVINTAAYNQVDRCEIERDLSWAVNATGPQRLAELCAQAGIRLVHYGTDYVFDGEKKSPYLETDAPNPLNHYAAGKLAGEQAVLRASPKHLVLRTSWVFGGHPTQTKTFVHTVLRAAREGRRIEGHHRPGVGADFCVRSGAMDAGTGPPGRRRLGSRGQRRRRKPL